VRFLQFFEVGLTDGLRGLQFFEFHLNQVVVEINQ